MTEILSPEAYRRIAGEFRSLANTVRDPEKSADALKMADDYERRATAAESALKAQTGQLKNPS